MFQKFRSKIDRILDSKRNRRALDYRDAKLEFENLEERRLLAATIDYNATYDIVSIYGTSANDVAEVKLGSPGQVNVVAWDSISTNQRLITEPVVEVRFYGNDGNDWFRNYTSIKTLAYGSFGIDTLVGGGGADKLYGQDGNDQLWGFAGNDELRGGNGDDYVVGGLDVDTLYGELGIDQLWGEGGIDYLVGGDGADKLYGQDGDDWLYGQAGDDTLDGGNGNDYLNGSYGNDQLWAYAGNDRLYGGDGDDYLVGGLDDDALYGDAGADQVWGEGGNDNVNGGGDNDIVAGQDGTDRVAGDDGDDRVYGDGGNDTLYGGRHNDQLYGGEGNDQLNGDDGDDFLSGGSGSDSLSGQLGNDQLWGDAGNDTAWGADGDDYIVGGLDDDTLYGDAGADQVWGEAGNDNVNGGGDNDIVAGQDGTDRVAGDDGDDRVYGDGGNDTLYGGRHNDEIYGGEGHDQLNGDDGDDLLLGGNGSDSLSGQLGNDQLNGGLDTDWLFGSDGDDTLIAIDNSATDYLDGGNGNDVYWINYFSSYAGQADTAAGVTSADKVQQVANFANGADLTLDFDAIADPTATDNYTYRNFGNLKLFGTQGPTELDVRQGAIGDCYFLAGLGSIATRMPTSIRQNVVDFNDGTFGVRLGDRFYRLDSDLAVVSGSDLAYAEFGEQGSAWVALYEKAFTHHRFGQNSYASISGGSLAETFTAFGLATEQFATSLFPSAASFVNQMFNMWNSGHLLTVGTGIGNAQLVGNHAYSVMNFIRNGEGVITHVILRNPWGIDGGSQSDGSNDGLVAVSAADLFAVAFAYSSGRV